jgi:hypothetical protein
MADLENLWQSRIDQVGALRAPRALRELFER